LCFCRWPASARGRSWAARPGLRISPSPDCLASSGYFVASLLAEQALADGVFDTRKRVL
jgi:hypothetical protein